MKKILQYGLYSLIMGGFIEVNATDMDRLSLGTSSSASVSTSTPGSNSRQINYAWPTKDYYNLANEHVSSLPANFRKLPTEVLKSSRDFRKKCSQMIDLLSLTNKDDANLTVLNDNCIKYFSNLEEKQLPDLVTRLKQIWRCLHIQPLQQDKVNRAFDQLLDWEQSFGTELKAFGEGIVALTNGSYAAEAITAQVKSIEESVMIQKNMCYELVHQTYLQVMLGMIRCCEDDLQPLLENNDVIMEEDDVSMWEDNEEITVPEQKKKRG